MPFLDDHRRCVPPQNVYRSIVVCIRAVAAMAADKRRLVLAALSVYGLGLNSALFGNFRSNWIKPNIQFGSYGVSKTRQLFDADILARAFDARNLTLRCAHALRNFALGQASRRTRCDEFSREVKFRRKCIVSSLVVRVAQKCSFQISQFGHVTSFARKLRERSRLLVGWVQLETVAAMDHVMSIDVRHGHVFAAPNSNTRRT